MIRFENVTKRYPNQSRPALDGIDLNIERGEFAFIDLSPLFVHRYREAKDCCGLGVVRIGPASRRHLFGV